MQDGTFLSPRGGRDDALARLRRALSDLGAHDAQQLLDEARAQAQSDVRDLLSRALRDSMLEVIASELTDEPTPRPALVGGPADVLYVYGVIAGEAPRGELPRGVDGIAAVRGVTESGLTALVSEVAREEFAEAPLREHMGDLDWVQETARRHERVLEAIGQQVTVIPMRMATVYAEAGDIRGLLARESRPLREALRYLDAKTEWGVKVYAGARRADMSARRPELEGARRADGDQRHRFREREARAWAAEQAEEAAVEIHDLLRVVAEDSQSVSPALYESRDRPGDMLLNGVYLVRDDGRTEFQATAAALAERFSSLGVELELTGPWPAYNFVPGTIDAAW